MFFFRVRSKQTAVAVDQKVMDYLSKVPRCSGNLVLADGHDPGFNCSIQIEPGSLREWIESKIKPQDNSTTQWRVGRAALSPWLSNADLGNNAKTKLPSFMAQVLKPYLGYLIDSKMTKVCCAQCNDALTLVHKQPFRESASGQSIDGACAWTCNKGHLLFDEQ